MTPNYTEVSHIPVLKGKCISRSDRFMLKKYRQTPPGYGSISTKMWAQIYLSPPGIEHLSFNLQCHFADDTCYCKSRFGSREPPTNSHVNSPRSSDVSGVHSERSAKRMKEDLPGASAAVAALGKFRNDFIHDSLLLSSILGQSPVLTVAVTFHTN